MTCANMASTIRYCPSRKKEGEWRDCLAFLPIYLSKRETCSQYDRSAFNGMNRRTVGSNRIERSNQQDEDSSDRQKIDAIEVG